MTKSLPIWRSLRSPRTAHPRRAAGRSTRRMVSASAILGLLLALASGQPATGAGAGDPPALAGYEVASPDGALVAAVDVTQGRLTYEVVRDGTTVVVAPSGLGLTLRDPVADLTAGMEIAGIDESVIDETWTPAWGTDSSIRNHANELIVHAVNPASGVLLDVVFRVFNDGVGFRYSFPVQTALPGPFVVTGESTQFSLPTDLTAYSIPAGTKWSADEQHYRAGPIGAVATAQTPITFARADGLHMTLHEADLTDYASMTVSADASMPGRLVSTLISLPNGDKAVLDASAQAFSTPWRTLTIGRDAGDLAESHLISNLNDACAICDVDSNSDGVADTTDWITPATYTGVWWELQRHATTWNAGPKHGATTARAMQYIDLAAAAGAKFVMAEGWNLNAGGGWTNQDFTTPMADFDIAAVLAYASSKGIGYIAHNETRGYVDYYDQNLERIFSQYETWGIHAIKTGYATRFDLGGVGRSHYDQEAVKHYQRVIDAAAEHHITIDAHEAIKPTGKERTYPNMMTGEGVAGMEQQNYMGINGNPPAQATILPFTRFMGGPADYTPGVLNVTWDPANLGTRVQSTIANQLALYTTFYSPLQMLADTPENYALFPEAFGYLTNMPTTWDESHVDAEIGDHVTTARRSGDTWYVGTVTDEVDRQLPIPLTFLDRHTRYVADIYTDAADATWKTNPTAVEVTHSLVDSSTVISADVVAGGGQAMRIRPATKADVAVTAKYDRARYTYAGLTVAFDQATSQVVVQATVTNHGTLVSQLPIALSVDGHPVATSGARIAGGAAAVATFTFADPGPYEPRHKLGLSVAGGRETSVQAEVAPYFDHSISTLIDRLIRTRGISRDAGSVLTPLAAAAETVAREDTFGAVRLAAQDLRFALYETSADAVTPAAVSALDEALTEYLGTSAGLPAFVAALRQVPTGDLDAELAAQLRTEALTALDEFVGGYDVGAKARVATIAGLLTTAGSPTALALLPLVAPSPVPTVYEAEAASLSGGASVSSEHPGYTGSGFVKNLKAVGAAVTISLSTPSPTTYDVAIRYTNGMLIVPLDRTLSLSVNSSSLQLVTFPNTGQDANRWRNWQSTAPVQVTTAAGANSVTLAVAAADTGNVNVDRLQLTPVPTSGVLVAGRSEAEDAQLDGGACVASTIGSFTGTGYASCLDQPAAAATFAVTAAGRGAHELGLAYTSAAPEPAVLAVTVNGRSQRVTVEPADHWTRAAIAVTLPAGESTVVISGAPAGFALDSISLDRHPVGADGSGPGGAPHATTGAATDRTGELEG